jgi:hypothetical protein
MPQKVTPRIRKRIAELAAKGWSVRQISEDVGLGTSTIQRHKPDSPGARPPREAPEPLPPPESLPDEPGEPLTAAQLQGWVGDQVRRQREEAARCGAGGDSVGQQRAAKTMAMFAAMLQRMLPKAEDGNVVRVSVDEMEAAAQQTRDDLHRLLTRELERMREAAPGGDRPFSQVSLAQSWIRRLCSMASSGR